jgi:probable HAF family extracellular repeat protein
MKRVFLRCGLAGVIAASASLAQNPKSREQTVIASHYTLTDLGLANGNTPGQPFAIKNDGLISGSSSVSTSFFAGAWNATLSFLGAEINLAKPDGASGLNSAAFGVNEYGEAVGETESQQADLGKEDFCGFGSQRGCTAFVWQDGVMSALPMLKDAKGAAGHNATAKAINISGQIGGMAENTTPDSTCPAYNPSSVALQFQMYQFQPVIWNNGEIQALPTSGSDASGKAFDDPDGAVFSMNDRGQAVGATGNCTGYGPFLTYLNSLHATLWEDGFLIDLGNLGGVAPGFGNFAYDINKSGQVIGTSGTSDGSFHAFYWSSQTHIQDLGTVAGDVGSVGIAINDNGDTGGVSFPADPNASPRAFVRPEDGTMVDMNTLIPANSPLFLFSVCSINSRGEIIGLAFDAQGNFHGYLATPSSIAGSADNLPILSGPSRFENAWSVLRSGTLGARLSRQQ